MTPRIDDKMRRHAEKLVASNEILRVIERLLRRAGTPASVLSADRIADLLANDR